MDWELIFVGALLLFAIVNFAWEKLSIDVTAITVFAVLLMVSMAAESTLLPDKDAIIGVFANPAPLTIAAMFIISAALERCGAIEKFSGLLSRLAKLPYMLFIIVLVLSVGFVSAFANNTPVVVVLMPVIISLARQMNTPASKLLIPLSYASIFGGVCTLMGTSTNLLMNGVIQGYGMEPLGFFELSWVGVPLLFIGTFYLALLGRKLLPKRETLTAILSDEERREYITEAYIQPGSDLTGKTFKDSSLRKARGVRLLEIIRNGVSVSEDIKETAFLEGDRLVLSCRPSGIAQARNVEGVDLLGEQGLDLETINAHEGAIVEGVIGPRSTLVGKSIAEVNFRQRYRMILLAVHRRGENVREQLGTLRFEFGDTLLMMGSNPAIERLRSAEDVILLDRPPIPSSNVRAKMPLVIGAVAAMVVSVSFFSIPIVAAAIAVVALLLLSGVIDPKHAYDAVEWRILILIYSMLALGQAMDTSGGAALAASGITALSEHPLVVLGLLYVVTSFFTEMLSNNATVVLMAPIAIGLAETLGVDARPFIIGVCIASSASFSTPIGYQTNTLVYSVGGYRFRDFPQVGLPLNFFYFLGAMVVIPLVWSF